MPVLSPKIVVLIAVDPMTSHRAVEALRIALGLGSHNEGADLCVVLGVRAPFLLGDDTSHIIDEEILEKHLPVFLEWGTVFYLLSEAEEPLRYIQSCRIKHLSLSAVTATIEAADRVLVFS